MRHVAALLLSLMAFFPSAQGQDKPKPTEPKPEQKEITGAPALKVLVLHWRAVSTQQQAELLRAELTRLNTQIQAALKAACEAKQMSPCKVVAIGEETLSVELETTQGGPPK